MKKLVLLLLLFVLCFCSKDNNELGHPESGEQIYATDASGLQYPGLDPYEIYCSGGGWGEESFVDFWVSMMEQYGQMPKIIIATFQI